MTNDHKNDAPATDDAVTLQVEFHKRTGKLLSKEDAQTILNIVQDRLTQPHVCRHHRTGDAAAPGKLTF